MKTSKRIVSLGLAASMVLGSASMAFADTKEETVYVNLSPRGEVEELVSSIWISTSKDQVKDFTRLENIINLKEDKEAKREGNSLSWEAGGEDVYYQGTSNEDLPVEIKISYEFNGKEVLPEDILGESGDLKIRIGLTNKDKEEKEGRTLYRPYIVGGAIDLDEDHFKNVTSNRGRLMSDGNSKIATNVWLPGFEESLDLSGLNLNEDLLIEAYTENFQLKPMIFTVIPEIPDLDKVEDLEDLNKLVDGFNDLKLASEEIALALDELYKGQESFSLGLEDLLMGTNKLALGSSEILKGAQDLKGGLEAAREGSRGLSQGAEGLGQAAGSLGQGLELLSQGAVDFSDKSMELSQALNQAAGQIGNLGENVSALGQGLGQGIYASEEIARGQEGLSQGLRESLKAVGSLKEAGEKRDKINSALLGGIDVLDGILQKLGDGDLIAKGRQALEGQRQAINQAIALNKEAGQGLLQLEESMGKILEASMELEEASKALAKGQGEIKESVDGMGQGLAGLNENGGLLIEASSQLGQASEELRDKSGQALESSREFIEASGDFSKGGQELDQGLEALVGGAGALEAGLVELNQGSEDLVQGGGLIKEASLDLKDGSLQIKEGMDRFNQEGIGEIDKKLGGKDIDGIMSKKDQMVDLARDNKSFSGIDESMEGSYKIILKTQELKKEEKKEVFEDSQEEEEGFKDWIRGIFRKDSK